MTLRELIIGIKCTAATFLIFVVAAIAGNLISPARMPAQSISRAGSVTCGTTGQVLFNSAGTCTSNSGLLYDGTVLTVGSEIDTVLVTSTAALGHNLQVSCNPIAFSCTLLLGDTSGSGHINETIDVEGNQLVFGASTGAGIDLQTGVLHVTACGGCAGATGTNGTIQVSDGAGNLNGSAWSFVGNGSGATRLQTVQNGGANEMVLIENTGNGVVFNNGAGAGGCGNCGTWVTDEAGDQIMAGQLTIGKPGGATGGTILLQSTTSGGVTLVSDNSTGGQLTISTAGGAAAILNNINQIIMGNGTQIQSGSNGTVTITDNGAITNGQITVTKINGVGSQKQIFSSTGTFTIPAGVTQVKFTITGGGGAGGGGTAALTGNGGGAGGTCLKWLTGLTPTHTIAVTVGTGGAGVSGAAGNNGVSSSIASGSQTITTVTAAAGQGAGNANTPANGGGCTSADLSLTGSWGNWAVPASGFGGYGGPSFWGGAGIGAFSNGTGNSGNSPGAGGGGGGGNVSNTAGGPGATGLVLAEWVQ